MAVGVILSAAAGCSLLPIGSPQAPGPLDPRHGAYLVVYSDSLSREAGASVVDERGGVLASSPMQAQGLNSRADSEKAVALVGERAPDVVIVRADGAITASTIQYPDGTGVTATAWLSDTELASLINVGATDEGYSSPLVIHDTAGKVSFSLPLFGYLTTMIAVPGELIMAGQIANPEGEEDGSRVVRFDTLKRKTTATYDWPDSGGLTGCIVDARTLWCLENAPFENGKRTLEQNLLVSIDLESGEKTLHATLTEFGFGLAKVSGRVLVASTGGIGTLGDVTAKRPMTPLATGDEKVERIIVTGDLLDVFVRNYNRTQTPDGRADVGHLTRLDPSTLQVIRQTPMQLPDQQLVGVHAIAREFFNE